MAVMLFASADGIPVLRTIHVFKSVVMQTRILTAAENPFLFSGSVGTGVCFLFFHAGRRCCRVPPVFLLRYLIIMQFLFCQDSVFIFFKISDSLIEKSGGSCFVVFGKMIRGKALKFVKIRFFCVKNHFFFKMFRSCFFYVPVDEESVFSFFRGSDFSFYYLKRRKNRIFFDLDYCNYDTVVLFYIKNKWNVLKFSSEVSYDGKGREKQTGAENR